jgi:hypothetical protein
MLSFRFVSFCFGFGLVKGNMRNWDFPGVIPLLLLRERQRPTQDAGADKELQEGCTAAGADQGRAAWRYLQPERTQTVHRSAPFPII